MKKLVFLFLISVLLVSCNSNNSGNLPKEWNITVVVDHQTGFLYEAYDDFEISHPEYYMGDDLLMQTYIPLNTGPIVRKIVGFYYEDNVPQNIAEKNYLISYDKVFPLHWVQYGSKEK